MQLLQALLMALVHAPRRDADAFHLERAANEERLVDELAVNGGDRGRRLRPYLDEVLVRELLDGFADGRAGNAQLQGDRLFVDDDARRELAGQNLATQHSVDLLAQQPTRAHQAFE